jgi:hypothetical protein
LFVRNGGIRAGGVGVPAPCCICSFGVPALVSGVAGVWAKAIPDRPMLSTRAELNRNAGVIIKYPPSVAVAADGTAPD